MGGDEIIDSNISWRAIIIIILNLNIYLVVYAVSWIVPFHEKEENVIRNAFLLFSYFLFLS